MVVYFKNRNSFKTVWNYAPALTGNCISEREHLSKWRS